MLKKIESLRKQPVSVRDRYAFWIATAFTGVIVTFWVLSVPARIQNLVGADDVQEKTSGSISRTISDMKAAVVGSQVDDVYTEEEVVVQATTTNNNEGIDFNTFFSTSTFSTSSALEKIAKPQKHILIGTSSPVDNSSTTDPIMLQ